MPGDRLVRARMEARSSNPPAFVSQERNLIVLSAKGSPKRIWNKGDADRPAQLPRGVGRPSEIEVGAGDILPNPPTGFVSSQEERLT